MEPIPIEPAPVSRADILFSSVFPPSGFADVWPIAPQQTHLRSHSPTSAVDKDNGSSHLIDPNRTEKRAQAWDIATEFLTRFTTQSEEHSHSDTPEGQPTSILWGGSPAITPEVQDALSYLFFGEGVAFAENGEENLLDWYINMVLQHYHDVVLPAMKELWPSELTAVNSWEFMARLAEQMHAAQQSYLFPFTFHLVLIFESQSGLPVSDPSAQHAYSWLLGRLRRDIVAACVHSVPKQLLAQALGFLILSTGRHLFHLNPRIDAEGNLEPHDPDLARRIRSRLITLLDQIRIVGLGGDRVGGIVAAAILQLLDEYVSSHHMKVDWQAQQSVVPLLREWVRSAYIPFMQEVAARVDAQDNLMIQSFTLHRCEEMAVNRLGKARTANLFDYVLRCHQSMGAVADLKEYLTLPGSRYHMTSAFIQQLQSRLLNHGSSPNHILDYYVYIIRTFSKLDAKGVLLDRVSRPLRRYLRSRPDTARVIISSLLACEDDLKLTLQQELTPTGSFLNLSAEIIKEILSGPGTTGSGREDELDGGNTEWTPDPVDAEPEYRRRSKSDDVISVLVTLYDNNEFVTELATVFGETLLRYAVGQVSSDFEREAKVLDLMKRRLGEEPLQACEVMLHDTLESRRLNRTIHSAVKKKLQEREAQATECRPKIKAQMVSNVFWPPLREDHFELPRPMKEAKEAYSEAFASLKKDRELNWFPFLGLARVELDLKDRVWKGDCQPWQASVIYSFDESELPPPGPNSDPNLGASQTVDHIVEKLAMDEKLVLNALSFWQAHDVLLETEPGVWAVQEHRQQRAKGASAGGAKSKALQVPVMSAVKKADDIWNENKETYQVVIARYVAHRKSTASDLYRFLQLIIEDGFRYPMDKLETLLAEMVNAGLLVMEGDKYRALEGNG